MQKLSYVIPCYRSEHTLAAVVEEITRTMAALPQYDYEIVPGQRLFSGRHAEHHPQPGGGGSPRAGCGPGPQLRPARRADGGLPPVPRRYHRLPGRRRPDPCRRGGQAAGQDRGRLRRGLCQLRQQAAGRLAQSGQLGQQQDDREIHSLWPAPCGKPPELVVNSYFAARRFVVDEMLRYEHCYPYVIGLVLRSTKHICNVPVHHRAREEGRSGYTLGKLLGLWMNGFTSFSVKPLRIASYFGTLSAVAGFLYMIYIIINHFTRHTAPLGWASTTALLLLLGGVILLVLGLIGEYVGRIYMCANNAPQYVAREYLHHEEASR